MSLPDLSKLPDDQFDAGWREIPALMSLTDAELLALRIRMLAEIARTNDNPEGFGAFYELVYNRPLPLFVKDEWVGPLYEARNSGVGVALEAFRGSTKSTTLTTCFSSFRIGHQPQGSGIIIQGVGKSAQPTIGAISRIIEFNDAWRMVWPNIVPDKDVAWGIESGLDVKRTDIAYSAWLSLVSEERGKDRCVAGYGADSGEIVGKHPTNFLFLDDIHDQRNTSSPREMASVKANIMANLAPAITPGKTFPGLAFTPWNKEDTYHDLIRTGLFRHIKTPVFRLDPNGDAEWEGQRVKLTWPGKWNIEAIEFQRKLLGPSEFARAFLLDLDKAAQRMFKWMNFKSEEISPMWPMVAGIDYASVFAPGRSQGGGSSHFAMCYTMKLPQGGAVVYDGIVEKCSQAEAETYVFRAQSGFRGFLSAVVEMDGKGTEFAALISRNPKLKLIPLWTKGRSKDDRVWGQMGPWLENGVVRISDADTPFLNHVRRFLNEYPDLDRNDPARDCADAMYWSLMGMPDVLQLPVMGDELPSIRKTKTVNPAKFLGSFHDNHL